VKKATFSDPHILLDHIAIGVPDDARVTSMLVDTLGGSPYSAGPGVGFRFWQWQFAQGGRIEVLRPDGPPGGFLHRFLDRRGPGIHHITFKVPDLGASIARAADLGFDIVGLDESDPTWKEAFIHPRQAGGVVIQLAEMRSPADAPEARTPATRGESPRDPVRIAGLRVVAPDAATVTRLYGDLLGGRCADGTDDLVFEWHDSPLRIAVSVDAQALPGPRCIEIVSDRPLALPDGPDPVLGTRFTQIEAPRRLLDPC